MTPSALAALLKSAADAHHVYEQTHGPDPEWWNWYAAFMTRTADITVTPHPDRAPHYAHLLDSL